MTIRMISRNPFRLQVQTRDALLTVPTEAEKAAQQKAMGRTDAGVIWNGILQVLNQLPTADRRRAVDELQQQLSGYEKAAGGALVDEGSPALIGDSARRQIMRSTVQANDDGSSKAAASGALTYIKERNLASGYSLEHPNTPPQVLMNEAAKQFWSR